MPEHTIVAPRYGLHRFRYRDLDLETFCGPGYLATVDPNVYREFWARQDRALADNALYLRVRGTVPSAEHINATVLRDTNSMRTFFRLVARDAHGPVAVVLLCSELHTVDPLRHSRFESFTASHTAFNFCLPEILPEYFDTVLDCLPTVSYTSQIACYPPELGYTREDFNNYSFTLPDTYEQYLESVSTRARQELRAVARKNADLAASVTQRRDIIETLFARDDFTAAYFSNLERMTRVMGVEGFVLEHMLGNLSNIRDPYVIEIVESATGKPVCWNIGELNTNGSQPVYIDKIAIPAVDDAEYRRRNLGLFAIETCIRSLIATQPNIYYNLDTGHGDYKARFMPEGTELEYSLVEYTSVGPDFFSGNMWHRWPLQPPLHIKGVGWTHDRDKIASYTRPLASDFYMRERDRDEFVSLYPKIVLDSDPERWSFLEDILDSEPRRYFVAYVNEYVPVGFVVIQTYTDDETRRYLEFMYVTEPYRGRALASKMLEHVHRSIRGSISLHVSANNRAAISLYERAGYRRVATVPGYYGVSGSNDGANSFGTSTAYFYEREPDTDR